MLTLEHDLSLDALLKNIWQALANGASNRKHAFHLGAIATAGDDGFPSARIVVLRKANPETQTLTFHADKRSEKISELRANPRVSWLFYDPECRVQLRLLGVATLHFDDELAETQWKNAKLTSRRCYISLPPLTKLAAAASGLPEWLWHRIPTLEESEAGRDNFAVVETRVHSIDWLWLNSTGHRRAKFVWRDGALDASWVAP